MRAEQPAVPQGRHVLIVEDDPDGRESLRLLLGLQGYRVDVAADGCEGVEKALALRPQAAVVDIGLPGLNGFEVARRLRAALHDHIRLIAYSAYNQPEVRQRALEAGFDAFLTKAIDLDRLTAFLRRLAL